MDISFIDKIEASKLAEYLALAGSIDLCLSGDALEALEELEKKEKQIVSKLASLLRWLAQKHPADLRSFLQNQEHLSKGSQDALQKAVQKLQIAENSKPYVYSKN